MKHKGTYLVSPSKSAELRASPCRSQMACSPGILGCASLKLTRALRGRRYSPPVTGRHASYGHWEPVARPESRGERREHCAHPVSSLSPLSSTINCRPHIFIGCLLGARDRAGSWRSGVNQKTRPCSPGAHITVGGDRKPRQRKVQQ